MQLPQQQQHQQQQGDGRDLKWTWDILVRIAGCAAMIVIPFTRRRCGAEVFRFRALVACFGMLIYAERQQSPEVMLYFWAWLLALAIQRFQTLLLCRAGNMPHSRDEGDSIFGRLPFVKTYRQARAMEAILVFIIGVIFQAVSEPLGSMIQFAAGGLLFLEVIDRMLIFKHREMLNDAAIEARWRAELSSRNEGSM